MEIDINQLDIAFGNKYKIYHNNEPCRFAKSKLFSLLSHIDIQEYENSKALLSIKKQHTFYNTSYIIEYSSGRSLEFNSVSKLLNHYQCRNENGTYDIYEHRGLKYSVYNNGIQIAWWNQEKVTWFKGDNYKIYANDNCDIDLLIAFCLIIDDSINNSNSNTITLNIGNVGPEVKEFNTNWLPK